MSIRNEGKSDYDVLVIHPGSPKKNYQELNNELTAVEPPMWCRLIAGYLRDAGHSVGIMDSEAEGISPEEVAQRIKTNPPQLIVMVVYGHQPSASTQQMVASSATCEAIKKEIPSVKILVVGGHVSALPERTLREENVDFACKGEGHVTAEQLLIELRKGDNSCDYSLVQGLVWWKNDDVIINTMAPLAHDLDIELHGNVWDLLPMEKYRAHNWQCFNDLGKRQPYASIYTSLGCPYKCEFCCINAPFDVNRYRMRSPEKVVDEIVYLHDTYGVSTFKIIDEMFVLNESHVLSICDLLIETGLDLNIWAYARVDTVKPHYLEKLRKAGIRWLALGIESGSAHVRDGSHKALKNNDIIDVIRNIQKSDINVIGNYIFGLPDDTKETMQQTLDLAKELNCEFSNFYSAMAYPGSQLYTIASQKGWQLPDSWSGYSQYSYDCQPLPTETLSANEVLQFRDEAFLDFFSSSKYLDMTTQRFGWETRKHIEQMVKHKLRRKILEEKPAQ